MVLSAPAINIPASYTGGLNTRANIFNLPDGQLPTLTGCTVDYGAIANQQGNLSLVTGGGPISAQLFTYSVTSYGSFLVAWTSPDLSATKMFSSNNLNGTWTDISGAVMPTSALDTTQTWGVLNNILCFSNSAGVPLKWTGSGNFAALGGSPPSATCLKVVNNFLFIAAGSTVTWSNVGDPETWTAGNNVIFRKSDGDSVQGLGAIGSNLVIGKAGSIGMLSTITSSASGVATLGPLTTITDRRGFAGPNAVDNLPDGSIVFLGTNKHIYRFDGSNFIDISDRPYPQSNVQTTLDQMNSGSSYSAIVRVDNSKNQVYVSFNSSGVIAPNTTLVYDITNDYWFQSGRLQSAFTNYPSAGGSNNSILVSGVAGNVYQENTGVLNDAGGGSTNSFIATVSFNFPPESKQFVPRSLVIPYSSNTNNTIQVTLGWDGVFDSALKTLTISSSGLSRYVIPISSWKANHQSMQVKFNLTVPSNGGDLRIYPIYISDQVLT